MCLIGGLGVNDFLGEVTTLTRVRNGKPSLKTTVPISYVRQFGLKEGDEVQWSFEAKGDTLKINIRFNRK